MGAMPSDDRRMVRMLRATGVVETVFVIPRDSVATKKSFTRKTAEIRHFSRVKSLPITKITGMQEKNVDKRCKRGYNKPQDQSNQ